MGGILFTLFPLLLKILGGGGNLPPNSWGKWGKCFLPTPPPPPTLNAPLICNHCLEFRTTAPPMFTIISFR